MRSVQMTERRVRASERLGSLSDFLRHRAESKMSHTLTKMATRKLLSDSKISLAGYGLISVLLGSSLFQPYWLSGRQRGLMGSDHLFSGTRLALRDARLSALKAKRTVEPESLLLQ